MAEGARLESVYTGNRIVGSNPTPSSKSIHNMWVLLIFLQSSNADLQINPQDDLGFEDRQHRQGRHGQRVPKLAPLPSDDPAPAARLTR